MAGKVRTRAMPGNRYGIDDANGMRLFTARLVEVGDRDDPRVRLDKIKLKAGKDVLLGGQVVLANHSSTLEVMKVVLDAQFNSLRSAFGLEGDAAYGVDPSIEVYFLPGHDEARKIGSSVDDGKSYCCSVVRGLLRLTAASENRARRFQRAGVGLGVGQPLRDGAGEGFRREGEGFRQSEGEGFRDRPNRRT